MKASLIVVCLAVLAASALADVTTLWPQPASVSSGSSAVSLSQATFAFSSPCQSSSILTAAFARTVTNIFPFGPGGVRVAPQSSSLDIGVVQVCVTSASQVLNVDIDVSYSITVTEESAYINATTVFGALNGLETFYQLVEYTWQTDSYSLPYVPIKIEDAPRFAWRGLMIDTARHYYDVDSILHIVDVMAQNKFNVLHWHIVDAESFPFVSTAYPDLSSAGAYHPTAVYEPADLSSIVSYAYERGINVMVEFDGPGHSYAMTLGYPSLGAVCPVYEANINNIPQNPVISNGLSVLDVVQSLYNQSAALFPFPYLHTGGDEVVTECWSDDPSISAWMTQNKMTPLGLYQYFEDAYQAFTAAIGRTMLIWEDPFDNGLTIPKSTIIEVWRDQATLQAVVSAGYRAILAAPYYLDKQLPNSSATFYEWEDTWQNFWGSNPIAGLSKAESELVLGGEACMWSEQVMATNFDSRVWPRAAGMVERFWSPSSVNNLTDAIGRLNAQSCRMQQRGVYCGPIEPSFCLLPSSPFAK